MKTILLVLGMSALVFSTSAQQSTAPSAQPAQPITPPAQPVAPPSQPTPPTDVPPPANIPPHQETGEMPPGRAFNPTNPPPGRPFRDRDAGLTNINPATGQSATNQPPLGRFGTTTNGAGSTNTAAGATNANPRVNFAITNALGSMSASQAQNVMQVQAGLVDLQNAIINIGGVQNVQQAIQQNPQVQQQLNKISSQITALAQGPKPSSELVQRLSTDWLRACSHARLSPDVHLVIAVIINQACNSSRLSPVQVEEVIRNATTTLQEAGIPRAVAHPITCDLHSIAYELQPNLGM